MVTVETISIVFTGLSVSLAAFYYISTLRNAQRTRDLALKAQELTLKAQEQALETRQAQLFMPIYAYFYDEDFIIAVREILFNWQWSDYDDYESKYGYRSNREAYVMRYKVGAYLEGLGVLVRRRLIEPSFVDDLMSGIIIRYWEKFSPLTIEQRKRLNYPQAGEWVEYLYNEIKPIVEEQHPELGT